MTDQTVSPDAAATERPFQADVARLLDLVVHSIYSDREIFLRELISNAADACEKLRFESATGQAPAPADGFRILIELDKDKKTLSVVDNGVGMTRDDLESGLGIIANSGTRAFLEKLDSAKDKVSSEALIGRFGIGFYSSFIVADRVDVFTRRAGQSQGWRWSSDGKSAYTVAESDDAPAFGTRVVLHLKTDAEDFLEPARVESVVAEHSAGVPVPITVRAAGAEDRKVSDGAALWARPRGEITPDQYKELYQNVSGQFDEPALTIHWRAEGRHEFDALAFIPGSRPFDLFSPERKGRSRLYVRRVLVSTDADLLPPWLRFVTLIVDSADVPLNVSREIVQKSPVLGAIRKAVVGRILQELAKLAENDPAKYSEVWANFGAPLKEGLYEDPERRDALFGLARFISSTHPEGGRTLAHYVADLRPNQTAIYYLTGADAEALAASPHLEGFRAKGVEVLLLSDPVDAFWVSTAVGFEGKPFRSITQGAPDIANIPLAEGQTEREKPELDASAATCIARIKETLGDRVSDVRASDRLAESAACLVASDLAPDRALAKILAGAGRLDASMKPVLEVNLGHPLLRALAALKGPDSADTFAEASGLVFDLAQIAEGEAPDHAPDVARRLSNWMARALAGNAGA
ncbi:MAG: molecular chaperone HtpG [Hyphomicrobiales bacterium]|nr:molecular chaperone HtpG [Hyphomicrobiales bacterium]